MSRASFSSNSTKCVRLSSALIAAQCELHAPTKNKSVSIRSGRENYDFAYASLDSIIEHVLRPVLPAHGLWFLQFTRFDDGNLVMVTEILHTSGESKVCSVAMPEIPGNPHEAGALISYFKRYALCAAFGLAAEDDEDARFIGDQPEGVISPDQLSELEALAGRSPNELDRLCRYLKVSSLAELPAVKFERARSALQVRKAA